ncbi:AAA domain-containing protein [Catalinimonas niigatensis]|uniref:AAA domain-containing protein n=1 Tax=Catalinimonas niigatensis TaxID=1397264 RepID=UPI0026651CCC|nr:AAA domain-containing protein [Catalinimonas niigatensis]WPP52362.1 AAA domain-containing protein [Catalinimonas niigatensis]
MAKSSEELRKVYDLLKLEKEADLEYYRQKVLNASLEQRKKEGLCWYPVTLTSQKYSMGEKLIIKLNRTTEINRPHVFQSGKIVSLFANTHDKKQPLSVSGVVNEVRNNQMTITLNVDELPDWINYAHLGIDLLFDEMAYREMNRALKKVMEAQDERGQGNRLLELREVLLGHQSAAFDSQEAPKVARLNESQNQALQRVMNARDVAIIHGPPGTGKTTTMVQAIVQTVKYEERVLVCAPSNAAVDLLTEKLSEEGMRVVRIGHPARVTDTNLSKTIDAQIANHDHYKDLKLLKRKAEEYRALGFKYKRKYGRAEREQRQHLLREASQAKEEAEQLEHYIVADIFAKADVITSTLVGASAQLVRGMRFRTVFIDEAAQALEAASWIPILKAERVVFAGDHFQLPPTVKSFEAAKQGLGETLMEKCIKRQKAMGTPADTMLQTQYRMHQKIMDFSGQYFYKGELKADESVKDRLLLPDLPPLTFIDTAGCGYMEKVDPETLSTYNDEEAHLLLKHLAEQVEQLGTERIRQEGLMIGVIAPYRAQTKTLTELFESFEVLKSIREHITIDTVDAFQGRERDIIYISLVRSNTSGEIGFLADERRMNVAMTRAKMRLVMIGDSATLGSNSFYGKILDYIQSIEAYQSAFELMY